MDYPIIKLKDKSHIKVSEIPGLIAENVSIDDKRSTQEEPNQLRWWMKEKIKKEIEESFCLGKLLLIDPISRRPVLNSYLEKTNPHNCYMSFEKFVEFAAVSGIRVIDDSEPKLSENDREFLLAVINQLAPKKFRFRIPRLRVEQIDELRNLVDIGRERDAFLEAKRYSKLAISRIMKKQKDSFENSKEERLGRKLLVTRKFLPEGNDNKIEPGSLSLDENDKKATKQQSEKINEDNSKRLFHTKWLKQIWIKEGMPEGTDFFDIHLKKYQPGGECGKNSLIRQWYKYNEKGIFDPGITIITLTRKSITMSRHRIETLVSEFKAE